jgi:hypothetical protein
MDHTYEEIRQTAIAVLAKQERIAQYLDLKRAVSREFELRGDIESQRPRITRNFSVDASSLSDTDANLLLEVFWNLFREGIITLGTNDQNAEFPWFRISEFGKQVLDNQEPYFFQDVGGYEALIRARVPQIDPITLIYLKESVQAFKSGCVLSASVMIGVASEHSFLKLLDAIEANPTHSSTFATVHRERTILRKLNAFKRILDQNLNLLPARVKEDLDTQFMSTVSMIRNFRNESGHPSGRIIEREQCYVLLQLFIPCCEKIYQLIGVFQ